MTILSSPSTNNSEALLEGLANNRYVLYDGGIVPIGPDRDG
jgi:hypothetical protein